MLRSLAALGLLSTLILAALPPAASSDPAPKRTEIGKNVFLEVEGEQRRVIIKSEVCLREGALEGLLTRKKLKEHEYILAADVDGRHIHAALLAARARTGSPVQFEPKYVPASGTPIRVTLRYQKAGKSVTVSAREWIDDGKEKKPLAEDWVFAGSRFVPDPDDRNKPPYYLANHGDLICLCNMPTAMLDLPIKSPKKFEDRLFQAATPRIPPLDTPVELILEPILPVKKER